MLPQPGAAKWPAAVTSSSFSSFCCCWPHYCECCHLHILHKMEMAKQSIPDVPASVLVLMKWIRRLNLASQGPGPVMRELRLNHLWLAVGIGCCEQLAFLLSAFKRQTTHSGPTTLVWLDCLFVCLLFGCVCAFVQLTDAEEVSTLPL